MTYHELKTWPEPFAMLLDGRKRFEIRKNDRGYHEGDTLILREYDPDECRYTGEEAVALVTCVVTGWGLPEDMVVMGVDILYRLKKNERVAG